MNIGLVQAGGCVNAFCGVHSRQFGLLGFNQCWYPSGVLYTGEGLKEEGWFTCVIWFFQTSRKCSKNWKENLLDSRWLEGKYWRSWERLDSLVFFSNCLMSVLLHSDLSLGILQQMKGAKSKQTSSLLLKLRCFKLELTLALFECGSLLRCSAVTIKHFYSWGSDLLPSHLTTTTSTVGLISCIGGAWKVFDCSIETWGPFNWKLKVHRVLCGNHVAQNHLQGIPLLSHGISNSSFLS